MVRAGLVIVLIAVLAALAGPLLSPYDPAAQELARRLEAPSLSHPFGLDELGRDILARLMQGARISLLVGLAVVSVSSTVGMLFGSIAGYSCVWSNERASWCTCTCGFIRSYHCRVFPRWR